MDKKAKEPLLQGLFPLKVNVGEEVFRSNILSSIKRDLPWLQGHPAHDGRIVIVAGGPSLADSEPIIRSMKADGFKIMAVNNTVRWLLERGIFPDYQVMLDAQPSVSRFVIKHEGIQYLIASQCAPETFDAAGETILWHPHIEGIKEFVGDRECALIGGGTTVGLQAMSISFALGYRYLHLIGFDSSYRDGEGHAYPQEENEGEPLVNVIFNGKRFVCARWMCHQVEEFKGVLNQLLDADCTVSVSGEGFLQEVFRDMLKTVLTAVYDLAVSPPTYDFIAFLAEAEKARIAGGHTHIDVVFIPGPIGGFRDDNLPPSISAREGMLQRICIPACRLLPSVRNVTVRKDRQPVEGNIFPEGWTVINPVAHYGAKYLHDAKPCLKATQSAVNYVKARLPEKYATITLREAEYWPERNSDKAEWYKVARWLDREGYTPVFIPDTSGGDIPGYTNFREASLDVDIRVAAYEGAALNLGVVNGPFALLYAMNVPYMVFKVITPECVSTTKEFLAAHGMTEGMQFSPNGKTVWKDDTAENIIRELRLFFDVPERLTA